MYRLLELTFQRYSVNHHHNILLYSFSFQNDDDFPGFDGNRIATWIFYVRHITITKLICTKFTDIVGLGPFFMCQIQLISNQPKSVHKTHTTTATTKK